MEFLGLNQQSLSFIMLIDVKMPTIVGILTFMNRMNFMLSWVEIEKKFYNLGARNSCNQNRSRPENQNEE